MSGIGLSAEELRVMRAWLQREAVERQPQVNEPQQYEQRAISPSADMVAYIDLRLNVVIDEAANFVNEQLAPLLDRISALESAQSSLLDRLDTLESELALTRAVSRGSVKMIGGKRVA